ncbi:hypothetical protein B0H13DRAFT_1905540 [Mycena leptocephala]|jgi:hypothetical protein|nr:hypothetical protein B0H13DRAFT_1905540 [Mycena leptocephala]
MQTGRHGYAAAEVHQGPGYRFAIAAVENREQIASKLVGLHVGPRYPRDVRLELWSGGPELGGTEQTPDCAANQFGIYINGCCNKGGFGPKRSRLGFEFEIRIRIRIIGAVGDGWIVL